MTTVSILTVLTVIIILSIDNNESFAKNAAMSLLISIVLLVLIGFSKELYENFFKDADVAFKWVEGFAAILFIVLISLVVSGNGFSQIIYDPSGKPFFKKESNFINMIFEPKLFTPNQLERNYDFIEFINSNTKQTELEKLGILTENKLPYFGYKEKYVWYLDNNKYTTFFITNTKHIIKRKKHVTFIQYLLKKIVIVNTE